MSLPVYPGKLIHRSTNPGSSPICWRVYPQFGEHLVFQISTHLNISQPHLNYISFLLNPSKGHPNVGSPVARWPHTSGRTGASADGPVPSRPRWCAASPPRCAAAMRSVLAPPELRQVAPGHPGPAQAGQPGGQPQKNPRIF